jgi:hypothetical protein
MNLSIHLLQTQEYRQRKIIYSINAFLCPLGVFCFFQFPLYFVSFIIPSFCVFVTMWGHKLCWCLNTVSSEYSILHSLSCLVQIFTISRHPKTQATLYSDSLRHTVALGCRAGCSNGNASVSCHSGQHVC